MNWLENRVFKVISGIVLIFFCWTFGGIFDIAYAIKSDQQSAFSSQQLSASVASGDSPRRADQPKAGRPEGKLQKIINDIARIIEEVEKLGGLEDKKTGKEKLRGKKAEIEVIDVEIRTQFAETEQKLKDAGLPGEILQRHYDFVSKYEENLNELRTNLDDIERYSAESLEFEEAIEKTKTFLEKVKPPKKHIPLDPNKLPHRAAEPTEKKPRTKKEDFSKQSTVNSQQ